MGTADFGLGPNPDDAGRSDETLKQKHKDSRMNSVKSSLGMLLRVCAPFVLLLVACGEPRVSGICYCHFFSGDDSEYDVRDLDLEAQRAECIQHDKDAEAFAGDCELEE